MPLKSLLQLFAFRAWLRKNSNAEPWIWLVPDLITALTWAPPKTPMSPLEPLPETLTSWISSMGGVTFLLESVFQLHIADAIQRKGGSLVNNSIYGGGDGTIRADA